MTDRLPACAGLITSAVTFTCEMVAQLKNVKESPSVSNSCHLCSHRSFNFI